MVNGKFVRSDLVLSCATPKVTFLDLLEERELDTDLRQKVESIDYTSPVTKINLALSKLPDFSADPNTRGAEPMPHHQTTIHFNCEDMELLDEAYQDAAVRGNVSEKSVGTQYLKYLKF